MQEISLAPASSGAPISSSATWGTEFRALFSLGWPLIVAQLAQISLLTTDTIMLGWLGPKYLAAAALANSMFVALQLFGGGVTGAVAPLVAQALGAKDTRSVRCTTRQGIWAGLMMGLLLLPAIWNLGPLYLLLGQDPELAAMSDVFLHYAVWLIFPAFQVIVFRSFLSAHGATRMILLVTLAGLVVNALLDYALIFGNWGFPRLELAGAGIATTTVNVVMMVLMGGYVLLHRRYRRYHLLHRLFEADWPRLIELLRVGVPIGLMILAEAGMFMFSTLLQGFQGEASVAAHAIALQLTSITFMVPLGLGQAAAVRVGLALGQGNPEGIRKAGWSAEFATLAFMGCCAAVFLLFPSHLVNLFLDPTQPANAEAIAIATGFLFVAALFQLFDGTQATMANALRGLSDTNVPLVIALVGYWVVGFPTAWLLSMPLGLKGMGVWWGLAAGLAATALILTLRWAMRDRLGLTSRVVT
jgi:MATE family multidrug resistance protein